MLSKVNSCITIGVNGFPLDIEVDISSGLPMFSTVGLPDGAVRESKDRVKAAIKNCGYEFPNKRITVNLAPADVKKEGTGYDLPIAIGILSANGVIPTDAHQKYSIIGELSLDGSVRGVQGILPMVLNARDNKRRGIIVPFKNGDEAAVVGDIEVIPVQNLQETVEFLLGIKNIPKKTKDLDAIFSNCRQYSIDFSDVRGQNHAKRALEIAASGNHNVLLKGPPGAGKTMLARRLTTILPDQTFDEAIETTKIHSIAGMLPGNTSILSCRPFRAPHHTISDAGLIGGGSFPKPGEISLANNGVLFLDELTEFRKKVLEMLRQPLEEGRVTIARANMTLSFPCNFILVAAYNPCPCGFYGDRTNRCTCSSAQIQRYNTKLSGPLLDRMDMHLEVAALPFEEMSKNNKTESSDEIRKRVNNARNIQKERYNAIPNCWNNSMMSSQLIDKYCIISDGSRKLLEMSVERLGLSARAYYRILKIARTIADMDLSENIARKHIAEAIQYRREG